MGDEEPDEDSGYAIASRWMDQAVTTRRGKLGIALFFLAMTTPFIFNVVAIVVVVVWVWPFAGGVLEKLAVLGFLFLVLNTVALQVARGAELGTKGAVFRWLYDQRRKKRKGPPDGAG